MTGRKETVRGRGGFTLLEVMVATAIMSALAVALIKVALSTKTSSVHMDRRLLAAQATKDLQSALKAYVTGDPNSVKPGLCGPNTLNGTSPSCVTSMWCISNSAQTDTQTGSGANSCYALNPGRHTLDCPGITTGDARCILPYALRRSPYNGKIVYTVSGSPPQVQINVNWTEP